MFLVLFMHNRDMEVIGTANDENIAEDLMAKSVAYWMEQLKKNNDELFSDYPITAENVKAGLFDEAYLMGFDQTTAWLDGDDDDFDWKIIDTNNLSIEN